MEKRQSFGEKITALRTKQAQEGGKSVGEILTEAQEGLMYSRDFFQAMAATDTLGVAYLRNTLGYSLPVATKVWGQKPWQDQVAFLEGISPTNEAAKGTLETISLFKENDLLRQTLWTVIDEVGRPSRKIFSEAQFSNMLGDQEIKGLVKKFSEQPGRRAFVFKDKWYVPSGIIKSRLAWPFIVKALGRVRAYARIEKEVMPRIQPLLDKASIDSNLDEQNLQKLLTFSTQLGSMVLWDDHSQVRGDDKKSFKDAGLLAIFIGRLTEGFDGLVLQGWVADIPLAIPEEEDYELPRLLITQPLDGGMEVEFGRQTHASSNEEIDSVKRIERLIRRWLKQEGKFRVPALKAPTTT